MAKNSIFPIIIDTNVFDVFFNPSTEEQKQKYYPVSNCVSKCSGVIFYGGTTFTKEIGTKIQKKSAGFLVEAINKGKIKILPKEEVDKQEKRIKKIEPSPDFDDAHIIACAIVGKCKVICTDDSRADKFIKRKELYPEKFKRPSIYRNQSHKHLLNDC